MLDKIKKLLRTSSSTKNQWQDVKNKWSSILEIDNNHMEAWVQLISAELNLKEYTSTLKNIMNAQKRFPNEIIFELLEARSYIGLEDFMKAKAKYTFILEIDSKNSEAFLQLSLLLMKEEKYEEAIVYAKQASNKEQSLVYIARAYVKLVDPISAIPYWEELISDFTVYKQEAFIQLSSIYFHQNMFDKSMDLLNIGTEEFPQNNTLWTIKAKVYESLAQYDKCLIIYKNQLTSNYKLDILLKITKIYLLQENFEKANHYVSLALNEDKNSMEAMVLDARIAKKRI